MSFLVVAMAGWLAAPSPVGAAGADPFCPPWPPPTGPTVTVTTEADLRWQATNAASGTTVLVSPGLYNLGDIVHVVHQGISIRGSTGDRNDVILDGGGMLSGHTHAILIEADDVTVADLTIRNAGEHGVSINARDRATLYNLHILDTGYQLVKVNPPAGSYSPNFVAFSCSRSLAPDFGSAPPRDWGSAQSDDIASARPGSEDGLLACSRLEYTTTAPENYTNGISAHDAHGWVVRDNQWYRIRTPDDVPAPTILFWSGSSDTVVERNMLVDNYQGIAFGNASHGSGDHTGGIVRNNWIIATEPHDSVIEMVHATGWLVANNTALLLNPDGVTWGMEARFSDTTGTFAYNLTNMAIWVNRDGAAGTGTGNVTGAESDWFAGPPADLHLLPTATGAIDRAATLSAVPTDIDGDVRPVGAAPDVGADEYRLGVPATVVDLRIGRVVTATHALTGTLFWTQPAGVVTTTVCCSATHITAANWPAATVLTDSTAGAMGVLTITCPIPGPPWYFALKNWNVAGASDVSNNSLWPRHEMFLPIHVRDG